MSSKEEIESYIRHKEQIKEKFKELCLDYDFVNYLKASDKLSVSLRIQKMYNIFKNIMVEKNDKRFIY